MSSVQIRLPLPGPLVKRLRHRPFTAVTWVRFPYGSPNKKGHPFGCPFFVCRTGIERPLRKCASGTFLGRGRFPWLPDASPRDVDGSQPAHHNCAEIKRPPRQSRGEKVSSGHFFRPWEIPMRFARKKQKMLDISIFPAIIFFVEFRSTEIQRTNTAA